MGWIRLYNLQGKEIDLKSLGLLGLKLRIPSPSYDVETETLEGFDGEIEIEQRLEPRNLTAEFWSNSRDYLDSFNKRDAVNAILGNGQKFYVSESNNPGRRWLVRLGGWDPERLNSRIHSFEIPLVASSGKSESTNRVVRKFETGQFSFKNEGSLSIDMKKQMDTEIEFIGASTNLTIINRTTGETWKHTGTTGGGDRIVIKGVRSMKNSLSIFKQTNKKVLSFAPGWNDIEIVGSEKFTLTIKTRFYFL